MAAVHTGDGAVEPGLKLKIVDIQMCPIPKFYMGF